MSEELGRGNTARVRSEEAEVPSGGSGSDSQAAEARAHSGKPAFILLS